MKRFLNNNNGKGKKMKKTMMLELPKVNMTNGKFRTDKKTRQVCVIPNTESNNVIVSSRNTTSTGLNTLCDSLFDTIKELKAGKITHKEASAMSSLAGNVTNIKKLQFDAHKYVSKTNSQSMTVDKLLGQ